jgi:WD40 repeat protein
VLTFAKPVAALAAAPSGDVLLVAIVDLGVSAWRLPAGSFERGFAPPPPVVIPVDEPPHPEAPNAVVVGPDGREAVVALENRLIRYAMDSGQVLRAFDGPGGVVRAAAWSPDGATLLVSTFYNDAGFLLDATDGRLLHRFPVAREGAAVAFAPDGRLVAVASETGPVALFPIDAGGPVRVFGQAGRPAHALAFVGDRLVAGGEDGMLRVWEAASGALRFERRLGPTLRVMAVSPDGTMLATAGTEPTIVLTALADGKPVDTLTWPPSQILALAWAGDTLVSGDSVGRVALWATGKDR